MKNVLAIILSIIMSFSFVACGKAEKYCSSCGEGISKNVAFCEHCGASVQVIDDDIECNSSQLKDDVSNDTNSSETQTSAEISKPIETSKPSETSKPIESSKPAETINPPTPAHTHSYSKKVTTPTCIEQGYTTYTCSCGDSYISDYTNITSHSYSKYVCTMCGTVDKTNAYEYFKEWVKANGTQNGENIDYIFEGKNNSAKNMGVRYSADLDSVNIWLFDATSGRNVFFAIYLDDYYYGFTFADDRIYGYINASTYTKNTTISYNGSQCSVLEPTQYLSTAQSSLNLVLVYFRGFLEDNNLGITLADLGFKSY